MLRTRKREPNRIRGQPPSAIKLRSVAEKLEKQGLIVKKTALQSYYHKGSWGDESPFEFEKIGGTFEISYHEGLGQIAPELFRTACHCTEHGGFILMRIRTTDKEPDIAFLNALINSLKKNNKDFKFNIGIQRDGSIYEISVGGIPIERMKEAMDAVDKAGKVLLEAKEMKQSREEDTDRLVEQLKDVKID